MTPEQVALLSVLIAFGVPMVTLGVQTRLAGRSSFATETKLIIDSLREERDHWRDRALACEGRES